MNRIFKKSNAVRSTFPMAGALLVSAPGNHHPLFAQSVCLIVEQSYDGTVGVVLNRPMLVDSSKVWKLIAKDEWDVQEGPERLHFGGPQTGPLVAIHDEANLADADIDSGVYLAADGQKLKQLLEIPDKTSLRLLVGHVSWKGNQLEEEISAGKWFLHSTTPELVFADDDQMWPNAVRNHGREIVGQFPGLVSNPIDSTQTFLWN